MSLLQRYPARWLPPWGPVALLLAGYFAARSLYFDYPLIWDARWYYRNFVLTGDYGSDHNSYFWLWLASWPNYFFPRNVYAYNVWIALLGTSGVAAFYAIVSDLFRFMGKYERLLATALFAFHPSVFASGVHVFLDTGLIIFWTWYLLALLKEKTLMAAAVGCGFLFTKEPALAHLPILFIFCALRQPWGERRKWVQRHCVAALVPLSAMGLFLYYKATVLHQLLFFNGVLQTRYPPKIRMDPDANLVNYLLMAFVLNFSWLLTGLSGALTIRLIRMPRTEHWMAVRKQARAVAWLLAATAGVVMAIRHYTNVRYLLPLFPAMIVYFSCVLSAITASKNRIRVMAVLLAACCWQNVRSVDPVSNNIFCTMPFGTHTVLYIPDFRLCSPGQKAQWLFGDKLAYNLEFLHIPYLINAVMQDVRPDKNTVFLLDHIYWYEFFDSLDSHYRITYADGALPLKVRYLQADNEPDLWFHNGPLVLNAPPHTLYYLEMPTGNNKAYRNLLQNLYRGSDEKVYDIDGYQLTVIKYYNKR